MNGHGASKATNGSDDVAAGVAFDLGSRSQWPGRANPDARYFCSIEAPELQWPLRFAFVRATEDDGATRWVCTGVEIGRPIHRDEEGLETDTVELTLARFLHIADNFDRYRLIAERRLIPTPENLENSRKIRRGMTRKHGERMTPESRRLLVDEWRALEGDHRGRMKLLQVRWGLDRSTIHRQLDTAEVEGLIDPGERSHRRRLS